MRRIGSRAVSWLVVAVVTAVLSPVSMSFAAQNGPDTINSAAIIAADGISGQSLTTGNGVKTGHLQDLSVTSTKLVDGAVTASKLGIVCSNGEYLQYVFGSGWVCSVGTAGPTGPQGPTGETGIQGPAGPTPHYANVVVVAKSGGDFTDIAEAIASISDASATNPYLIKIMPGIYNANGRINMKSYVSIQGAGPNITTLHGVVPSAMNGGAFINMELVSNVSISDLSVENIGSSFTIVGGISILESNNISINNVDIKAFIVSGVITQGLYATSSSNVIIKNVNMPIESNGSIRGFTISNSNNFNIDNTTIKVRSLNDPSSVGFIFQSSTVVIRNSVIDSGSAGAGDYSLYGNLYPSIVQISNSDLKGSIKSDSDQPVSTFLINNTKIDGIIQAAYFDAVKCFNTFDANYMSYACN